MSVQMKRSHHRQRTVETHPAWHCEAHPRYPVGQNGLLSDKFFSTYALPFGALSFVLLAAVIGAIVLARKD